MKNENTERIRERVISLIESEYESDAAFERALGLAENNWLDEGFAGLISGRIVSTFDNPNILAVYLLAIAVISRSPSGSLSQPLLGSKRKTLSPRTKPIRSPTSNSSFEPIPT